MDAPEQSGSREAANPAAQCAPMVSVVMPVYNGARTLRDAIDSVLAQTFRDFEFIVVDDASTDDSAEIVRSYGDRIRFVRRRTNSGICAVARTEALSRARGRYIAFIDQDDLWDPRKLERQVAFMEAHPELPLSHTYAWIIDGEGKRNGIRHDGAIPPTGPCARELLRHCFITVSTLMSRARAATPEDEIHRNPKAANSDFLYFFSELQKSPAGFGFIPEPLASYRKWSSNMSRGQWKWGPEDVPALITLAGSGLWAGLVSPREMRDAIVRACLINAEHYFHEGSFARVCYFAAKGWVRRPGEWRFPFWIAKIGLKKLRRR